MLGKNKSNPLSLIKTLEFAEKNKVNLKPKKKLGQNFIIDQNMIKKIVDCVSINEENEILEIGAGTGNLTDFLIKKPKKFI